jgi:hypothetical protein
MKTHLMQSIRSDNHDIMSKNVHAERLQMTIWRRLACVVRICASTRKRLRVHPHTQICNAYCKIGDANALQCYTYNACLLAEGLPLLSSHLCGEHKF